MKLAHTRIYAEAETAARGLVATAKAARAVRMEGYSGPAQPSPTIGRCLNGGYGWLEIECCRCRHGRAYPLDANPEGA
jgi:hypothetical protein